MKPRLYRSGWVMLEPDRWMENGLVEVADGRIASVCRASTSGDVKDCGPGVIMPALVNAHTHLGLSALNGLADNRAGFVDWVEELILLRSLLSPQDIWTAVEDAIGDLLDSGTGLIGEVGEFGPVAEAILRSDLNAVIFQEILGNGASFPERPADTDAVSHAYAGHGLHTTSPNTLRALKEAGKGKPFSIHLAESDAETEFLATGAGEWADLLTSRGIDFSDWDLIGERPVPRALRLGLLDPETLATHLLEADRDEIELIAKTRASVCACPRSNLALHGKTPDLESFMAAGLNVALGTDSLASAPSLNMLDEMAFVADRYPSLSPHSILSMAGRNAARALGREDLGVIAPGKTANLIYVGLSAESSGAAAERLVSGDFLKVERL